MSEYKTAKLISTDSDTRMEPKILSRMYEFYLSGEIGEPSQYIDWFDTIRNLSENDIVKIRINSVGGDLYTAIQFMRVLSDTDAEVVCSVEGACMSAATIILLSASSFEITQNSIFMVHDYSSGTFGKGGEMLDQLKHERAWSERLLRDVYKNFLSESEIVQILNNKDIWLDSDEVSRRLTEKIKLESEENGNADDDSGE